MDTFACHSPRLARAFKSHTLLPIPKGDIFMFFIGILFPVLFFLLDTSFFVFLNIFFSFFFTGLNGRVIIPGWGIKIKRILIRCF